MCRIRGQLNLGTWLGQYPIAIGSFKGHERFVTRCFSRRHRSLSNNSVIHQQNSQDGHPLSKSSAKLLKPKLRMNNERSTLYPHVYSPSKSSWCPLGELPKQRGLDQGELLRVISWNIDFMCPGQADRAFSAMSYLKDRFGDPPPPLVLMLQEITYESLTAILACSWVREHFAISGVDAPQRYFTIMMVSQNVPAENWFRFHFQSNMQRDALVVNIPISSKGDTTNLKKVIRLCTTHLESLPEPEGKELRPLQLAQISALLKELPTNDLEVAGGLVGGDMNTISKLDSSCHKAAHINLRDIWEETNTLAIPELKPFQKDLTYGRASGCTWGKQSRNSKSGKRFDKFLYTGSIDIVSLAEAEDHTGKVGRLGIGLKTKIKFWGKKIGDNVFQSDEWSEGTVWKEIDAWVSDHYGIAIGIKVP